MLTFCFDFSGLLQQYWRARYTRPCFESNSSAVYEGAIVRLAEERSLQGGRINVEWLTSLCWRNEFSIHSQASRGETSFRKVNTIWQGPTTDAKAQHGTVGEEGTLLCTSLTCPCFPPGRQSSLWQDNTSGLTAETEYFSLIISFFFVFHCYVDVLMGHIPTLGYMNPKGMTWSFL